MSSNAYKRTVSLCYVRFKRGAPSRKNITCTIARATVVYRQIGNGNIANQIQGFTIDYGKFILITHRCNSLKKSKEIRGQSNFLVLKERNSYRFPMTCCFYNYQG